MSLRTAAQQALEALDLLAKSEHPATNFTTKSGGRIYPHKVAVDAAAALRTALAEPVQKSLTDEEIELLAVKHAPPTDPDFGDDDWIEFARAIERAHGIGSEA